MPFWIEVTVNNRCAFFNHLAIVNQSMAGSLGFLPLLRCSWREMVASLLAHLLALWCTHHFVVANWQKKCIIRVEEMLTKHTWTTEINSHGLGDDSSLLMLFCFFLSFYFSACYSLRYSLFRLPRPSCAAILNSCHSRRPKSLSALTRAVSIHLWPGSTVVLQISIFKEIKMHLETW